MRRGNPRRARRRKRTRARAVSRSARTRGVRAIVCGLARSAHSRTPSASDDQLRMIDAGATLTLDVEKATAGGRMLARHQGQVVLVWGAIPGERVDARVERTGKGVAYAETIAVRTPSPDRRMETIDWRCGGNVLAHVEYARQLRLKGEIVQDAFARIGRIPLAQPPLVTGSREDGYRMRARLHASNGRLGVYREGSHDLCSAVGTRQLLPSTNEWIERAEALIEREARAELIAVEIAENIAGDERACHLELREGADASRYA